MDLGDQFETEHLYLTERTCRVCGETKDLIDGFYKIRKKKYNLSSYSYECKYCTIKRVSKSRKSFYTKNTLWEYPDW
jgi:hypothetical protein